jgi:hypothetical protein
MQLLNALLVAATAGLAWAGRCQNTALLTADSGSFYSGTEEYIGNSYCEWQIEAQVGYYGGSIILLQIVQLQLEENYDFLKVYDVNNVLLKSFTGSTVPPPLLSTSPTLKCIFTSDHSFNQLGFSARYQIIVGDNPGPVPEMVQQFFVQEPVQGAPSQCTGSRDLNSPTGQISDGSASELYSASTVCQWLLPWSAGAITELAFSSFDLETSFDYVKISDYNSGQVLMRLSGSLIPPIFVSDLQLLLVFVSDTDNQRQGFTLDYTVRDYSPSMPLVPSGSAAATAAPVETNTAAPGSQLSVSGMGATEECFGTTIFLGISKSAFGDGPGNYRNNKNCRFFIAPPGALEVRLSFTELSLEQDFDWIKVYQGPQQDSAVEELSQLDPALSSGTFRLLASLTGTRIPSRTIVSTSGNMVVRFSSDSSVGMKGFMASYTSTCCRPQFTAFTYTPTNPPTQKPTIPSSSQPTYFPIYTLPPTYPTFTPISGGTASPQSPCAGPGVYTAVSGVLTDGPGAYRDSTTCRFLIAPSQVDVDIGLHLWIVELKLESEWDWLWVFDGEAESSPLLAKFSGFNVPVQPLVSRSGRMLVRFQSDASINNLGFVAIYNSMSSSRPQNWAAITNPPLEGDLNAPSRAPTQQPSSAPTAAPTARLTFAPNVISLFTTESNSNALLAMTLSLGRCEGVRVLRDRTGVLGDGPGDYPSHTSCSWLIQPISAGPVEIRLEFKTFETEANFDMVRVFDGANMNAPLLAQISGSPFNPPASGARSGLPDPFRSTSGSLLVDFSSDESVNGAGFLASYTTKMEVAATATPTLPAIAPEDACGKTRIFIHNSGNINSNEETLTYPRLATCRYLIRPIPPSKPSYISLEFTRIDLEQNWDFVRVYDGLGARLGSFFFKKKMDSERGLGSFFKKRWTQSEG